MIRAAVVGVEHFRRDAYRVWYKVLKRGPKKKRYIYLHAQDELAAFMEAQKYLRRRGFKL